jgi:hypothetical protein
LRTHQISCAVLSLVTFLLFVGPADAQTTSVVKFNSPVQLPGVSLASGNYTFAVTADARTVVVSNAKGQTVTVLQVLPITRAAAGDTVTMRAAVGTAAPEISALFEGGGTHGIEFVYRRQRK